MSPTCFSAADPLVPQSDDELVCARTPAPAPSVKDEDRKRDQIGRSVDLEDASASATVARTPAPSPTMKAHQKGERNGCIHGLASVRLPPAASETRRGGEDVTICQRERVTASDACAPSRRAGRSRTDRTLGDVSVVAGDEAVS